MLPLFLGRREEAAPLKVLALGAHSDDIEIGAGATLLKLIAEGRVASICWVVLSGNERRAEEARASAEAMLVDAPEKEILQPGFRDGFFPYDGAQIKEFYESLKPFEPDVIFTHQRNDLHQDHRMACQLALNTFRNHMILEYEIPKYDGDMGAPNLFVGVEEEHKNRKVEILLTHFESQFAQRWFKEDLFSGLMRLRGMECNSPSTYAEAFYSRKAVLG
jgi:LmbE family N-acetylglucosaminyl deacetylase